MDVKGASGLLSSQQDALFTSIWTLGGGALRRRQEYQLRTQHELWVRRQVELKRMSIEEAHARIQGYTPSKNTDRKRKNFERGEKKYCAWKILCYSATP